MVDDVLKRQWEEMSNEEMKMYLETNEGQEAAQEKLRSCLELLASQMQMKESGLKEVQAMIANQDKCWSTEEWEGKKNDGSMKTHKKWSSGEASAKKNLTNYGKRCVS